MVFVSLVSLIHLKSSANRKMLYYYWTGLLTNIKTCYKNESSLLVIELSCRRLMTTEKAFYVNI